MVWLFFAVSTTWTFFCDDTWTERSFYHVNRVTIPQNFKAESSAENFVGIRILIKTQQTILFTMMIFDVMVIFLSCLVKWTKLHLSLKNQ